MGKKVEINPEANKHLWKHRDVSSFLNEEYRDYSIYCAMERACPSLIDGFKITQRKILHSAFKGACKNGALVKLLNLTGDTLKETLYAHGDSSLNGGIVGLGQDFADNLNPLFIEGQSGTLRDQSSVSAPRYLYVKLNKYANLLYKTDYDLLEYINEEGQLVEPKHYLPIIPTVLCRNNTGMAPGYRFSCMSYNPIDIIDSCVSIIKNNRRTGIIRPYVRGIKQSNWEYTTGEDGKNYWINKGEWSYNKSKDIMTVTDLPYDMGFDDWEKLLNKYLENEYIKDWRNYSEGQNINYEIIFDKGKLKKEIGQELIDTHLPNKFKLIKKMPDDLLWVLDENNKVRYFATPGDLIDYFVSFRLNKYNDRKSRLIKVLEERLKNNSDLCRFIELVIKNKLKINNRPRAEIKKELDGYNLPDSLLSVSISKLTKEEYEALLKENEDIRKELEYIRNTSIEDMYLKDLKELKKSLVDDFPDDTGGVPKKHERKAEAPKEETKNTKTRVRKVKIIEEVPKKRHRRTKAEMEEARKNGTK